MKENNLMKLIMLAVGKFATVRIFRNNVAMAWTGKSHVHKGHPKNYLLEDGDAVIYQARPLHAGLCEGSSDLVGWKTIEVTPEMVGKKLAVFTALEVKTPTGKISKEQLNFIEVVRNSGGIAGIVRENEDVISLLK